MDLENCCIPTMSLYNDTITHLVLTIGHNNLQSLCSWAE